LKKFKITDANGKEFNIDLHDVTDTNTDLDGAIADSEDSDDHQTDSFNPVIVDSDGNTVDVNKLLDVNSDNKIPRAIDVNVEVTHTGQNKNSFVYHSESMAEDTHTWTTPFPKPLLKNHDSWSEPMGRIIQADFCKSEINPDRECIDATFRVTDQDAIPKFLDGRYRTVSIGGSAGNIQCGICGKEILKDGQFKFCGHWKGETYDGKKALWHCRNIDYNETSVVNNPADSWAQIKKITVVTNNTGAKDEKPEDANKPDEGSVEDKTSTEDNIYDTIDHLADQETQTKTPEDTKDDDKVTKEMLDAVTAERDSLKENVKGLEGKVTNLSDEVNSLNTKVSDLAEENKVNIQDAQESRQQSIKLAVINKKLVANKIVDFELINKNLEDEKKDDRLNELMALPMKDLMAMSDGLMTETIASQRKIPDPVPSPGLADNNQPNVTPDGVADDDKTEKETETTMKDFEDLVLKAFIK
jgi:hypothetical protein